MQETRLARVLRLMKDRSSRGHHVQGEMAIAGKLTAEHITGTWNAEAGERRYPGDIIPTVSVSDTATIQSGAFLIRTIEGSSAFNRTHTDHYVYIPFRSGSVHNACVMRVEQIILIKHNGMGWRNGEARIAVGMLWDHLAIRRGAGLEVEFNDDPSRGACSVPRALQLTPTRKAMGYQHAVFVRQIHCPCVYIPDPSGDMFMTVSKMGYHGRKDLLWKAMCGQPVEQAEMERWEIPRSM